MTEAARRRLTTILSADVCGYSRLIAADEEGTLAALRDHRLQLIDPKIAEFGGRIANTAGDSLLIEFPSVVGALRFAIAMQKGIADRNTGVPRDSRVAFRIGVNLGDVVEQDGDLLGAGVNVAARLEGIAEPGGILLSGAAFEQVRGRVECGFTDLGAKALKNIPDPVHVYAVDLGGKKGMPPTAAVRQRLPPWIGLALAALVFVAGAALWWMVPWSGRFEASHPQTVAATAERPAIAVLPFDNMSNDPDQEYFADGMTDDLITDLSKISALMVIARNSVFAYKGRTATAAEVARELGVRYVLEGSVRKSGGRVRINSQLIDTTSGAEIWADRFDREIGDIFSLQDDVTKQIVMALALRLTGDDKHRLDIATPSTAPEVYDLYLRGIDALRQFTPESIATARAYFFRALAIDPDFARAYATLAFTYSAAGIFFSERETDEAIAHAIRYAGKALELDSRLPQGHFAMAIAYLRQRRHDEALAAAKEAVRLDPNYADGYVAYANILVFMGRGNEAEELVNKAMGLNPRYSAAYIDILGRARFVIGRYDQAIETFQECVRRNAAALTCHIFLAATYAAAGQIDNAKWEVAEIVTLAPDFTLATDTTAAQFAKPEDRIRLRSALRQAGIPAS